MTDGDTIEVLRAGKTDRVRLLGLNAPELYATENDRFAQRGAREAKDALEQLVCRRWVCLETDEANGKYRDQYGRLLAYVWADELLVNHWLIANGFAEEYTYRDESYRYQATFKDAEWQARQARVGLWNLTLSLLSL